MPDALKQPLLNDPQGPGVFCPRCNQQATGPVCANCGWQFAPAASARPAVGQQQLPGAGLSEPDDGAPSAPPLPAAMTEVGPQPVYGQQPNLHTFHAPAHSGKEWHENRRRMLLDMGTEREHNMYRAPRCLIDQLVSGSGLYPLRLLDESWFSPQEIEMTRQLENLLQNTGHAQLLSYDMLAPLVYDLDVRIILDDSGSMQLDMFGNMISGYGGSWIDRQSSNYRSANNPKLQRLLGGGRRMQDMMSRSPLSPNHRRWFFARDHMRKWMKVYQILGLRPPIYLLNGGRQEGTPANVESIFTRQPSGSTPLSGALQRVMMDHRREKPDKMLHIVMITDGEANNMRQFSQLLDSMQNQQYGDVQVCIMGLSLVPEDIEWFENEECEDTRIRTVEAFEVELAQMMRREVVKKEGDYNFAMHTYRVLVTNLFPSDYDYEAPIQNIRHRFYITWHGRDRWWAQSNCCWWMFSSTIGQLFCTACWLGTGACCCGWLQGFDCGQYRYPDCVQLCCENCGDE